MRLYNSLTKRTEKFKSLKAGRAGLYTCGPTVYDYAHIGNLRSYVFADILCRVLRFNGYKIKWVMNITDVEDKTIKKSQENSSGGNPKKILREYTKKYEKLFWRDMDKLNVSRPQKRPRATETIKEMQKLVVFILEQGYAYVKDGSVYFDVKKYSQNHSYGQLVSIDPKELKTGARVDADEYDKENAQDFVLWKGKKEGEPFWDFKTRIGPLPGRPGWHLECSAMAHKYLSTPFDIHTGGIDLKFPHHENEIAQSAIGYQIPYLANFFLHNDHVLVDGQRMGKRFKNFYTLADLEKKDFSAMNLRYLFLIAHYRSQLNFTWEALGAARNGLKKLNDLVRALAKVKPNYKSENFRIYRQQFQEIINQDLDTPQALAFMWQTIGNKAITPAERKALLFEFDKIFGLGLDKVKSIKIPVEILQLAEQREKARRDQNWQEADKIRLEMEQAGYSVLDNEDGFLVRPIFRD